LSEYNLDILLDNNNLSRSALFGRPKKGGKAMKKANRMITRRITLGAATAGMLARPSLVRSQTVSATIKVGLLSDVAGPYGNVGGAGGKVAVELAVEDFGGSLLGRPIEVVQADIQNKPDVSSAKAREWIDPASTCLSMARYLLRSRRSGDRSHEEDHLSWEWPIRD
jgi:hypothetical protein